MLIIGEGQVGKVLGEKWKALSEKQRKPYEDKAVADKQRYENEKAAYNVSFSSSSFSHLPCLGVLGSHRTSD